jgi:hypothetical protein
VPDHLDQRAAPAAEHEQISAMCVAPQAWPHQQPQSGHAPAHVGVAHCNPYSCTRRDHRRALRTAVTSAGDAVDEMRTQRPSDRLTTIAAVSGRSGSGAADPATTSSVTPAGTKPWLDSRRASCLHYSLPVSRSRSVGSRQDLPSDTSLENGGFVRSPDHSSFRARRPMTPASAARLRL